MASSSSGKSANFSVYAGHVLDWGCFESCGVSWKEEVKMKLESSGLKHLCSGPVDLLAAEAEEFYTTVQFEQGGCGGDGGGGGEEEEEEAPRLVGRVGGVQVVVSAEVLQSVFQTPGEGECVPLPSLTLSEMGASLNYCDPGRARRRYHRKSGFYGKIRFLAMLFGKCLFCQRTGTDSVPYDHLQCIYSFEHGLNINWAKVVFDRWAAKLEHKSFGRLLTKVMQHQHPRVFRTTSLVPYPSKLVLKHVLQNGGLAVKLVGEMARSAKEKTTTTRGSSSSSSKAGMLRGKSLRVPVAEGGVGSESHEELGEQAVKDTPEAVIEELWVKYAQEHVDPDGLHRVWLRYGESLIRKRNLISWAWARKYINARQRDKLLKLSNEDPAQEPPVGDFADKPSRRRRREQRETVRDRGETAPTFIDSAASADAPDPPHAVIFESRVPRVEDELSVMRRKVSRVEDELSVMRRMMEAGQAASLEQNRKLDMVFSFIKGSHSQNNMSQEQSDQWENKP